MEVEQKKKKDVVEEVELPRLSSSNSLMIDVSVVIRSEYKRKQRFQGSIEHPYYWHTFITRQCFRRLGERLRSFYIDVAAPSS